MDYKRTEATRYMCAAAHLHTGLRNWIIENIVDEDFRAIGPSYGVDLLTVVKHCLSARRRKITRDIIIGVLILPALLIVTLTQNIMAGIIFPITVWVVVIWEMWVSRYHIVARSLSRDSYDPDDIRFVPNRREDERLAAIAEARDSNVVVYSGFSPFTGAGFDVGGWSFAININKSKQGIHEVLATPKEEVGLNTIFRPKQKSDGFSRPMSFRIYELYNHLADALKGLDFDGLSIEDKLFINGRDIRNDHKFLPDPLMPPHTRVPSLLVKSFVENPTQPVRHYKSIQMISWNGELVLSIFLRFCKSGQSLFTEASYFLLPPLKEEYHEVDSIQPTPSLSEMLRFAQESAFKAIGLSFGFPLVALFVMLPPILRLKQRSELRRIVKESPTFNYGARTSAREVATSSEYRRYFQKLDKEMFLKVIERRILDSIVEFLDSRNIDTSDLRERQTTILNNGVIMSGGSISSKSIAIGEQAKSVVARFAKAAEVVTGAAPQGAGKA